MDFRLSTIAPPATTLWPRLRIERAMKWDENLLLARATSQYNIRESWERAKEKHDPLLAPHGMFRALKPGSRSHAVEFLAKFGPLEIPGYHGAKFPSGQGVGVDLRRFWNRHEFFNRAMTVYECSNDKQRLLPVLAELVRHRLYWRPSPLLAKSGVRGANGWINWLKSRGGFGYHRKIAMNVLGSVLNREAGQRHAAWISSQDEFGNLRWRMEPSPGSLWAAMWELFALDTQLGTAKTCTLPGCEKVFYPRRRDQDCCTTRHQTLWSKREYAARRRAEEKARRESKREVQR